MTAAGGPPGRAACDLCRARAARYYRRYSGHRLCFQCLSRALARKVRRSLRGLGAGGPGAGILVPVTSINPQASVSLAYLLDIVERRFGARIFLAAPQWVRVKGSLEGAGFRLTRPVYLHVEPPPGTRDPIALERFDRAWSRRLARLLGARLISMGLTNTDILLLAVSALLRGELGALGDYHSGAGGGVLYPLAGVEGEALAGLAAFLGVEACSRVKPELPGEGVAYPLLEGTRPELEFSFRRSIELFRGLSGPGACRVCGGSLEGGRGTCGYCRSTRAGEARILMVSLG